MGDCGFLSFQVHTVYWWDQDVGPEGTAEPTGPPGGLCRGWEFVGSGGRSPQLWLWAGFLALLGCGFHLNTRTGTHLKLLGVVRKESVILGHLGCSDCSDRIEFLLFMQRRGDWLWWVGEERGIGMNRMGSEVGAHREWASEKQTWVRLWLNNWLAVGRWRTHARPPRASVSSSAEWAQGCWPYRGGAVDERKKCAHSLSSALAWPQVGSPEGMWDLVPDLFPQWTCLLWQEGHKHAKFSSAEGSIFEEGPGLRTRKGKWLEVCEILHLPCWHQTG